MKDEAIANEKVDELKQAIANSLNEIECWLDLFKYECTKMKWNSEVAYQIEGACKELGFALATLTNWHKEDEEEK